MALKDVFKVSRKTFFNPRAWLNYDEVKAETKTFWTIVKTVFAFTTPSAGREESFAQAVQRLKLSDTDIQRIDRVYLILTSFFLIVGIGLIALSLFLLLKFYFLDFILALAIAGLPFSQAFRFHFWHFQIKHRKLGCTFDEWRRGHVNTSEG